MELKTLYAVIAGVILFIAGIFAGRMGMMSPQDFRPAPAVSGCGCAMPGCACGQNCACGAACPGSVEAKASGCGCGMQAPKAMRGGCKGNCQAMQHQAEPEHGMAHQMMAPDSVVEADEVVEWEIQPLPAPMPN